MNIIQWHHDNLDYRTLVHQCYLNINGKTEAVSISKKKDKLSIARETDPVLEVDLRDLDPMSQNLYYFEQDNGFGAMLVIPFVADDYEDDE